MVTVNKPLCPCIFFLILPVSSMNVVLSPFLLMAVVSLRCFPSPLGILLRTQLLKILGLLLRYRVFDLSCSWSHCFLNEEFLYSRLKLLAFDLSTDAGQVGDCMFSWKHIYPCTVLEPEEHVGLKTRPFWFTWHRSTNLIASRFSSLILFQATLLFQPFTFCLNSCS